MPREIYINHAVSVIDGDVVTARRLGEARQANRLLLRARRQATTMIRKAREEADNCRQLGFVQGYRDGFFSVAMNTVDFLDARSALFARVEADIVERLRQRLSGAMANPAVLLSLIDEWQMRQPADADTPVLLRLPRSVEEPACLLKARMPGRPQRRFEIEYHDEPGFILEAGDEVVRFDPQESAADIAAQLKRSLMKETLPQFADSAINDAIENLWYALQERYRSHKEEENDDDSIDAGDRAFASGE
ncbi:hypothetical protein [Paludibacterium paludis]|uniref:Oxygen-regulated invasion protein OrgB n=1 Tax=Paludibacterium paludis TaxID=1225769 RepID=A0A918P637_9NEIS|nr:hypothetical protein [Paludibacterium paludis]GGY23870.1 hypothetical protein GCM10011289_29460 [Paludibacterium paludis]